MYDEPLFGKTPVHTSRSIVEKVCVTSFADSATRESIWEGFGIAHTKIQKAGAQGEIWISGDFVDDREDPDYAQVHLRIPEAATITDKVTSVIDWLTSSREAEELSCDTTALVMVPEDDPHHSLIREYHEFYLSEFTAHESGRKGFPILTEPPPP
jgi:hypothetical protein